VESLGGEGPSRKDHPGIVLNLMINLLAGDSTFFAVRPSASRFFFSRHFSSLSAALHWAALHWAALHWAALLDASHRDPGSGEDAGTLQVDIDCAGGSASFIDCPDDQALSAPAVTGCENTGQVGGKGSMLGGKIASLVEIHSERFGEVRFGTDEAHCEQDQLSGNNFLGIGDFQHLRATASIGLPLDADSANSGDVPRSVVEKFFRENLVLPWIVSKFFDRFLVAIIDAKNSRPLRPGIVGCPRFGRLGEEFEIDELTATMADRGPNAVGTRIPTPDDDNILPGGTDESCSQIIPMDSSRVGGQKLHRWKNPAELPSGDRQIARFGAATGEEDCVKLRDQGLRVNVRTDILASQESDSFSRHFVDPALDDMLVEFHVRNAILEQPPDPIGALVDGDAMSDFVQLVGCGESRRTRTDDRDAFAGPCRWGSRNDPPFGPPPVDDRIFNILNRHRGTGDPEDASSFAGGRACSSGKLWKVIRFVESFEGVAPAPLIDHIVPFGDQVIDRTTAGRLTEGDATVHAPRPLFTERMFVRFGVDLFVIPDPHNRQTPGDFFPIELFESGGLSHRGPSLKIKEDEVTDVRC